MGSTLFKVAFRLDGQLDPVGGAVILVKVRLHKSQRSGLSRGDIFLVAFHKTGQICQGDSLFNNICFDDKIIGIGEISGDLNRLGIRLL